MSDLLEERQRIQDEINDLRAMRPASDSMAEHIKEDIARLERRLEDIEREIENKRRRDRRQEYRRLVL